MQTNAYDWLQNEQNIFLKQAFGGICQLMDQKCYKLYLK